MEVILMRGLVPVCAIAVAAALLGSGCGKPTLPGQTFRGELAREERASESPLPDEPIREWGPEDAKVRVVAFYPMDDEHQPLMELLEELVERYGDRLYVKYVDYRTPEGQAAFQLAEQTSRGLLINGDNSVRMESDPEAHEVTFVQEMGRYWTADDLRAAVAQEVRKAYGEAAVPSG
jgi:hypothetical protein